MTIMPENQMLQEWLTPFGTPPFSLFRISYYKPAIEEAIGNALKEIDVITGCTEKPCFENVIGALDCAGRKLNEISQVLFNLNSAETNGEMQALVQEVTPLLARFSNDITLNEKLFLKIKSVYDSRSSSGFTTEQEMLVEKNYRNFILGGAGLDGEKKLRFREISEELSLMQVRFEENVLKDTNAFELNITDRKELSGLPESVIEMASIEARDRKKEGWVFTLHAPSYIPFMKYSDRRELREKMFRAYNSRSFHGDSTDNRDIATRIANLRLELARILGFNNFAEMALTDRMADSTGKVKSFLDGLYIASKPASIRDFNHVKDFASARGLNGELERWDWAYYSEKLQKTKFNIDDEVLKPYFVLENAQCGIFDLASALYGIKFVSVLNIEVYNPEVKTWQVNDKNNDFLGILYIDYFPRPGKNGGAWMTSFRDQRVENGVDVRPFISIVANFTRPTMTLPSLLSFNEVTTFLHEFGHSLHGLLSKCTYESLSGTSVARDFVELPSQFMQNFAYEKEWMKSWARHYKTNETIPDDLLDKIKASSTFNEGYACNRQLSLGFLDMAWHTIPSPFNAPIEDFESETLAGTELFPHVEGSNISVSFTHIFGGGYAAGYYGYKWAEVLDADAFKLFREKGIFDRSTAESFRKHILEKGGTDKPVNLYKAFRGNEPTIDAFLERSGLK
ncbi:MAG: M3 family metallopeptidase [Bacteroidales bacterium]|jgi:peptidyl-dipeptidase Dcp